MTKARRRQIRKTQSVLQIAPQADILAPTYPIISKFVLDI
jgi:hypothetical protein